MKKETLVRFPAEWEQQDAIALAWPHEDTDWAYMLDEVSHCFYNIASNVISMGERLLIVTPEPEEVARQLGDFASSPLVKIVEVETNDTWARDTFALTTYSGGVTVINDYKFNGWGLKFASNKDNLITSSLRNKTDLFKYDEYKNNLGFVLEGGSVESDGCGTILTTSNCLLSLNRNGHMSKSEIEERLKADFGALQVLWVDYGDLEGDDTDSHIDTLARMCPNDTILYVGTSDKEDSHYECLAKMKEQFKTFRTLSGKPYNLVELPLPKPIYDDEGNRLPATYANFLIGNGFVLVPTYRQEFDEEALRIVSQVFPNRKIIGVDCVPLIQQHGSLHCVTMQFPENSINF